MGIMKMPKLIIDTALLNIIAEIDEFKGAWKVMQILQPEQLTSLKTIATIESIGSSTRIEGVKLTDAEVEALLGHVGFQNFCTRDEQEVAGYAAAMDLIFQSHDFIELTENNIKQIHSNLLKYSTKDEFHRGEYKKNSNSVKAFDHKGQSLGIIFETASPFDTPRFMTKLLEWTNKNLVAKDNHPLLVIAMFVLVFLAIHPFLDGNGRLSRILTTLLLIKTGYSYVPYSSLEKIIEENKDNYYLFLRRSQKGIFQGSADTSSWLKFFAQCLKSQKDSLCHKIENFKQMQPIPELSVEIIKIVKNQGRIVINELVTLTKANRNTIKLHLRKLVASGNLKANGSGKGTFYTIGASVS